MIETVMTYEQWQHEYTKRQHAKRKEITYYVKQKITGLILISLSILIPVFLNGDVTISILLFPFGLYLLFTRERVIN